MGRSSGTSKSFGANGSSTNTGDAELLVSMAQRLGTVEKELLRSKRELIEKVYTLWVVIGEAQLLNTVLLFLWRHLFTIVQMRF